MASVITPTVRYVLLFIFCGWKNLKAAEIHCQLDAVYGENIISDSAVRQWSCKFQDGQTSVHEEKQHGQHSVISDGLVEKMNEKIRKNHCITITELLNFIQPISRTVLYEVVTERLLQSLRVPKLLTDDHKTKILGSAMTFLSRYDDEGDEFLSHIITGDEILSYCQHGNQKSVNAVGPHQFATKTCEVPANIFAQKAYGYWLLG